MTIEKKNQLDKQIDHVTDRLLQNKAIRHVLFSVESLDGKYDSKTAKGRLHETGDPVSVDTPFWIASITKMFIAIIVLRLSEEGTLDLSDYIVKHIPKALMKGVHVLHGRDYGELLTIDHLLKHASGIPDYMELKQKDKKTIIDRIIEGDDRSWDIAELLGIVKDAQKPRFKPQDVSKGRFTVGYSDTNYQLLIEIITQVTKLSFQEALDKYIILPLQLTQTTLPRGEKEKSTASVWLNNDVLDEKPQAIASFHDLNSTLRDLTRFMRALIHNEVFEHPGTFELMASQWQTFGFGFNPLTPGWPIQYGRGMMRFQMPRLLSGFKGLPPVIGHTGATGSWLFYCQEHELIFAGTVSQATCASAPYRVIPSLLKSLHP